MKTKSGLKSETTQKNLVSLFRKMETSHEDLLLVLGKYLDHPPAKIPFKQKKTDLLLIAEKIGRAFLPAQQKFIKGHPDGAIKHLRKCAPDLAVAARNLETIIFVGFIIREMIFDKIKEWFSLRRHKALLEAWGNFWLTALLEVINAYHRTSEKILNEKNLESSILFHTSQSLLTELDMETLLDKVVLHASMLLRIKETFLFMAETPGDKTGETPRLFLRAWNQEQETYGEHSVRCGEGPIGKVAKTLQPVVDNKFGKAARKLPFLTKATRIMAVPIIFSEKLLGVILAADQCRETDFAPEEKELFLRYASQIAVPLKNVLLYQEQSRIAKELEEKNHMGEAQSELILRKSVHLQIINEVSQRVNSSLDLREVLNLLEHQAAESIGINRCVIWLFDDKKMNLEAVSGLNLSSEKLLKMSMSYKDIRSSCFMKALSEHKAIDIKPGQDMDLFQRFLRGYFEIDAFLVIPLVLKDQAMGVMAIGDTRETHEFLDDEISLLLALANQTVLAIENARLYQKVKEQSITDGLTGLYNHRFFQLRFSDEFMNSQRYKNDLAVIMMDIDHFKLYNDTYGHIAGDLALKEIAGLTRATVRENDLVSRYGGEELAIILPMTNNEGALIVAERIRKAIAKCRFLGDMNVPQVSINVSLGVSEFKKEMKNREDLLQEADLALYAAKEQGRNRVIIYNPLLADTMVKKQF